MQVNRFERTIRLSDGVGGNLPAALACEARCWTEGGFSRRTCVIALCYERGEVVGEGPDFFEAFCRIREALGPWELLPSCYGASRDVYPSGMARDMGDGLSAYRMRLACEVGRAGPNTFRRVGGSPANSNGPA